MSDTVRLTADQVVSRKSGWVTYIDQGGTQRKTRASRVEVVQDHPVFGTPDAAAAPKSQVSGETKVASEGGGKKRRGGGKKTDSPSVRTIGGKAVNISNYVKSKAAGGGVSFHNGDEVAVKLAGKDLDAVYEAAAKALKVDVKDLKSKYKHLNVGMQRMALGNRMRKANGLTAKAA